MGIDLGHWYTSPADKEMIKGHCLGVTPFYLTVQPARHELEGQLQQGAWQPP